MTFEEKIYTERKSAREGGIAQERRRLAKKESPKKR